MSEEDLFNNFLKRNPNKGTKNNITRTGNVYNVPNWVFSDGSTKIRYKTLKRKCLADGITDQILYDIVQLGITDIKNRPICPICGKPRKFRNFSDGYKATCTDKRCISELSRLNVTELWKDDNYRKDQITTKKEWMNSEKYKKLFKERALAQWSDASYREKQVLSHIEFCKNNPDKVFSGQHGEIFCNKINKIIIFDSSWEKDFIIFCDKCDLVSTIEKPNFSIPYLFEDVERNYFPDFIVTLTNNIKLLIEIKSDWLLEKDNKTIKKLSAGMEFVNTNNIFQDFIVLIEKDLYTIESKPVFKSEELTKRFKQYYK